MHLRACTTLIVLAMIAGGISTARGQTKTGSASKAPQRTAQRGPARSDVQPAANNAPDKVGSLRGPVEPAGKSPSAKGGAAAQPQGPSRSQEPVTQPAAPKPPFLLTETQQKLLDQILIKWEKQSDKVKTFKCSFTRWEYDKAYGNPKDDFKKSEGQGQIKYKAPDCGEYVVNSLIEFDLATGTTKARTEGLDHWLCDGKSIFEFNAVKKQLIERRLPPQLQGKAIADGPLPFIFGAKAEQLKRRYWMRDVTPKEEVGKSVWLEAIPKYQQDSANFQSATVILNDADFMPKALRIFMPGGEANSDYGFASSKVNDPLAPVLEFLTPKLSPTMRLNGWKYVLEEDPDEAQKEATKKTQPTAVDPAQAKRPTVGRK